MENTPIILSSDFIPHTHAFRFANSFPLPRRINTLMKRRTPNAPTVYGLCGGMCFAALDYYYAKKPVPKDEQVPTNNRKLYNYLWKRQLASFRIFIVPFRIIAWMLSSDSRVSELTANKELLKLKNKLQKKEPTVIALVRQKGLKDPTQNHQVLVTSLEHNTINGDVILFIYDPNHPREKPQPRITLNVSRPTEGINIKQSTHEKLRGFFVIQYTPKIPPNI